MILCVCKNISASAVKRAQHDGHASFEEIQMELGAATCCGKCEPSIRDALRAMPATSKVICFPRLYSAAVAMDLASAGRSPFARGSRSDGARSQSLAAG